MSSPSKGWSSRWENGALGPLVSPRGDFGCPSMLLQPRLLCKYRRAQLSPPPKRNEWDCSRFDVKNTVLKIPGWGNRENSGVFLRGVCRAGAGMWLSGWIPPGSSSPGDRGVSGQALGSWSPTALIHPELLISPCEAARPEEREEMKLIHGNVSLFSHLLLRAGLWLLSLPSRGWGCSERAQLGEK